MPGTEPQPDVGSGAGRVYTPLWAVSLAVAVAGMVAVGMAESSRLFGYALLAVGGSTLALLALNVEVQQTPNGEPHGPLHFVIVAAGAVAFVVGVAFAAGVVPVATPVPLAVRLMVLATAFQALLLNVDIRGVRRSLRARVVTLVLSHGAIFAGSLVTVSWGPTVPRAGVVLYAVGFASLLLNAFWARSRLSQGGQRVPLTNRRRWEAVLLAAIVVGISGAIAMALTTRTGTLTLHTTERSTLATMTGVSAILALALLSAPPSAPAVLRWLDGPAVTVAQHVLALFVIVNGFFLGVFVVVPWLLHPVFAVFMGILVVSVVLNYASLVYAWRRGRADGSEGTRGTLEDASVTVVVSAMNEVDSLSDSLRENLETLAPLPFLLVAANRSTDGTQALMHEVRQEYPDRVRVVEASGGSKAADLNEAWDDIDTPHVLVLDADETVEAGFVTRALGVLAERPGVGIVQGRKVAADPTASGLSLFASAERQRSTWLGHPFEAGVLGAAHFAGSAAVLRREVLPAVDGFATDMLTEDIDLALRLYLETDWDVEYVPEVTARELLPGTRLSLFGQRERWARGWAQVAGRHLGRVILSSRRLGARRTVGLSWILFLAVGAPLYIILPALALPTLALDVSLGLSLPVVATLAAFLLPERAISYVCAVLLDPEIPGSRSLRSVFRTIAIAYLWIAFGWVVQLHSLYLQLAGAPQTWTVTRKARTVRRSPSRSVSPGDD